MARIVLFLRQGLSMILIKCSGYSAKSFHSGWPEHVLSLCGFQNPHYFIDLQFLLLLLLFFFFFFFFFFLSSLHTQHGAQTHNPNIKSHLAHRFSQPGTTQTQSFSFNFLKCLFIYVFIFFQYMKFIVKLVSIQHPALIPKGALLNTHHPPSPPSHHPSTLSLFSVFNSLLCFGSLPL